MNRCILILALILLFKPVLPVLGYLMNYEYIAKELCINKNDPGLHCSGKCQLKSELAKASDTPQNGMHDKKVKTAESELLFIHDLPAYVFEKQAITTTRTCDTYQDMFSPVVCNAIFHPPIA